MHQKLNRFVDGIEQLNADPLDRQPDTASLDARGIPEFGDPVGTSGLGGGVVIQQAARNGRYQHWASWGDTAAANLSDSDARVELFEKGALSCSIPSTNNLISLPCVLPRKIPNM